MNIETGCHGKWVYFSKAEAKRIARLMTRCVGEEFHLYHCPNCGCFHVGHLLPAFLREQAAAASIAPGPAPVFAPGN